MTGDDVDGSTGSVPSACDKELPVDLLGDWREETAYDQPPHPSFRIGNGMTTPRWLDVHYAG